MPRYELLDSPLSERTSILGLRLWAAIILGFGGFVALVLLLLMLWLFLRKSSVKVSASERSAAGMSTAVFKDIKEVDVVRRSQASAHLKLRDHFLRRNSLTDAENEAVTFGFECAKDRSFKAVVEGESIPLGNDNSMKHSGDQKERQYATRHTDDSEKHGEECFKAHHREGQESHHRDDSCTSNGASCISPVDKEMDVGNLVYVDGRRNDSFSASGPLAFTFSIDRIPENLLSGWGHCYTLRELEIATDHFADSNIIGKGGYGVVYRGVLRNGSMIAVKKLLNNRGQAGKEFRIEVETIGRIRHKNLVLLLGYCVEESKRMLVYEYVDNGNLQQWLHGMLGERDPLTWDSRMKIIFQTAKGLAYLHEDLDPKVVHRDVKSSNILLDKNWNVKISDFGLAKLLGIGISYIMTRVMGTFGYVAPEYVSTGLLTEKSDVYSFGVLMMEVITGKDPVDHSRPTGEVNLVDWMKAMIGSRRFEEVIDERLAEKPSSRALKKALLVALKCVDPDAVKRPTMGHVVHMLEADNCHVHCSLTSL